MPTRLLVAHGEGELIFFVARHPRTSDPMMLGRRADAILEVHRHVPQGGKGVVACGGAGAGPRDVTEGQIEIATVDSSHSM